MLDQETKRRIGTGANIKKLNQRSQQSFTVYNLSC
jgi:hypothetical protein